MPLEVISANITEKINQVLMFTNQASAYSNLEISETFANHSHQFSNPHDIAIFQQKGSNIGNIERCLYLAEKPTSFDSQQNDLVKLLKNKTYLFEIAASAINPYTSLQFEPSNLPVDHIFKQISEEMPLFYDNFIKSPDFVFTKLSLDLINMLYDYLHDNQKISIHHID